MEKYVIYKLILFIGLPHRVTKDDIYEGYLIPEGSTLMPNIAYEFDPFKRFSLMICG